VGDEPGRVRPPDDLPRSASGRVPKWVVDEALARAPDAVAWRAGPDLAEPGAGRGRRGRGAGCRRREGRLPWLSVVVIVGVLVGWAVTHGGLSPVLPVTPVMANAPTPGREEAAQPRGLPAALTRSSSSYRFTVLQADGKTPVAYDPCRPVHYVVRAQGAPVGGEGMLSEAVQQVARATGLQFRDDGTTSEAPSRQREPFQKDRYGDRWAPVLIAWVTPQENPDFAADVVGKGGSIRLGLPGQPQVYVSGQVELDAAKLTAMLTRPGGRDLARAVIEHELGHLVGLAHVTDPTQLMYPQTRPGVTDYAAGDLTGLATLGRGPCAPGL
jgi:hypothetical protein